MLKQLSGFTDLVNQALQREFLRLQLYLDENGDLSPEMQAAQAKEAERREAVRQRKAANAAAKATKEAAAKRRAEADRQAQEHIDDMKSAAGDQQMWRRCKIVERVTRE